jgi:hypothetical protein
MSAQVTFDPTQAYPVPLGAGTANPMPDDASGSTDVRGRVAQEQPKRRVDVTGVWLTNDNAQPTTEVKDAYRRWFAFYRTRILAMRGSVMNTFSPTVIPDGKVRLAWQGLSVTCSNGFPASGNCPFNNAMWPLDDAAGGRHAQHARTSSAGCARCLRAAARLCAPPSSVRASTS